MAEGLSHSLYYLRSHEMAPPGISNTKPRRMGDCGHPLSGHKGHGFVTKGGTGITCSLACLKRKFGIRA